MERGDRTSEGWPQGSGQARTDRSGIVPMETQVVQDLPVVLDLRSWP
jgi:hypothetical protein